MSIAEHERQELAEAVQIDPHGIEPIPDKDRDSTPVQQFWIWAGANIAPINWVLGALGIILGLSLVETLIVVTLGNLVGCALFGVFCVMGHRTGVNQMVLSRSAFGRRGAYVPGVAQLLLTMGWVGVNTWVVLDLTLGVLDEIGVHGGTGLKYVIGFVLMAVQVVIAIYGFYLIRTFEKYTVPIAALIMVVMSVLAVTKTDVTWSHSTVSGADKITSISQLLTAIGIGWGISWFTYSSDYTRFVARKYTDRQVFWGCSLGMFLPTVWLAALGATIASSGSESDPSRIVASVFGVMTIPVLLARGAFGRAQGRALEGHGGGRRGGVDRADRLHPVRQLRPLVRQLDRVDHRVDQPVGRHHARRVLRAAARQGRRPGAVRAAEDVAVR
jgi:nucleobase:cation symporter-1, NCS1 family